MSRNRIPSINIVTPNGIAIYPKLNTPDTKFEKEGVYETKLRLDPDAEGGLIGRKSATLTEIITALEKLRDDFVEAKREELEGSANAKTRRKAKEITVREIGEPEFDDDDNETGNWILKAKMKAGGIDQKGKRWSRQPKLFDAKNTVLSITDTQIWGGSTLKVALKAQPYYAGVDNVVGISMYLEAVQVIDLVSGSGRDASAYGFGEEDGYEGEEAADEGPSQFADADDSDDSDEPNPDF